MEAALNGRSVMITAGKDPETGKTLVDQEATKDANGKIKQIKQAFAAWIWEDDERKDRLHRYYNDNMNNIVKTVYDGSHLTFPGLNPAIKLRDAQKNFVWQVVTTGKGLAGHEVGYGKTLSMVCAAMELRRLGLAKKPAIACLKSNIEQITKEAMRAYPGARIISTANLFTAGERQKAIARIAAGDYDLVLLTHDHLNLMKMKPETIKANLNREIADLEGSIISAKRQDPSGKSDIVKSLEKAKERLEAQIMAAVNAKNKDDTVFFEDSGIDHLMVDEAHYFKTLPCYTHTPNIKGVPTGRSQRATNMLMRTRWLMEHNNGRGVVFATGTPVANTMAELYNMQRYLQPEELEQRGISSFDDWKNAFTEVDTKIEKKTNGQYGPVTRMRNFVNIPELMGIAGQMLDIQRIETLPHGVIVRPNRHDSAVAAPETPAMKALMKSLEERSKAIAAAGRKAEKGADNMLVVCTDGRKGSIDMRLLDPNAPDDPTSKLNMCIDKVLEIYHNDPSRVVGGEGRPQGTQLIFSDIGVHPMKSKKAKKRVEPGEEGGEGGSDEEGGEEEAGVSEEMKEVDVSGAPGFHMYQDIIDKLVAGGIPRERIADFSQLAGARRKPHKTPCVAAISLSPSARRLSSAPASTFRTK